MASFSASREFCSTSSTVVPVSLISRMILAISVTISGDRPMEGSSSSSTRGPAHDGGGYRQHLLLAAAQRGGLLTGALLRAVGNA